MIFFYDEFFQIRELCVTGGWGSGPIKNIIFLWVQILCVTAAISHELMGSVYAGGFMPSSRTPLGVPHHFCEYINDNKEKHDTAEGNKTRDRIVEVMIAPEGIY